MSNNNMELAYYLAFYLTLINAGLLVSYAIVRLIFLIIGRPWRDYK